MSEIMHRRALRSSSISKAGKSQYDLYCVGAMNNYVSEMTVYILL
jgi:hypothetical protein